MHRFPLKYKERLNKWTHLYEDIVQRPLHFADSAFTVNAEVAKYETTAMP